MKIIGTRNRDMNELWYAQAVMRAGAQTPNSGIEAMLMKDDLQDQKTTRPGLWLESCKCHSHYNAALATRKEPRSFELFVKDRLRGVRPPDYLCLYLNTPQNRTALGLTGPDVVMTNELNEVYQPAMRILFGVVCTTVRMRSLDEAIALLARGYSLVAGLSACHSVMFKGYDAENRELIYVDPDPPRQPAGKDWKGVRMGKEEFERDRTVKPVVNIFPPEES